MTLYTRHEPDYNGWTAFETFFHRGFWWWTAVDDNDDHVGFHEGPFDSESDAHEHARKQEH